MSCDARRRPDRISSLLVLVTAWLVCLSASDAAVIGLPSRADTGNCFPFGCSVGITRYQEVYSRLEFPGPLEIGRLDFFAFTNGVVPLGNLNSGTYTLSLSTTQMSVGALSENFVDNLGPDNKVFAVAVLTGDQASGVLSFLGEPFLYDPTTGNLLLDIQIAGSSHLGATTYFQTPVSSLVASRLYTEPPNVSQDTIAPLVTAFLPAGVPEPSTLALILAAVIGFTFFRQRA